MASFPASLAVGDITGKYISVADEMLLHCVIMRRGNRSVAERRTRHKKVEEIFFSMVELSVLIIISVFVPPRVTAVVCKRSRSFCQTCRWQAAAKHTCT